MNRITQTCSDGRLTSCYKNGYERFLPLYAGESQQVITCATESEVQEPDAEYAASLFGQSVLCPKPIGHHKVQYDTVSGMADRYFWGGRRTAGRELP